MSFNIIGPPDMKLANKPSHYSPEANIEAVKSYWNANPLLSFEFDNLESDIFFNYLDRVKREDSDKFALNYWGFDRFSGRRILDIGCGPGWLAVQYALGGAFVTAVDLTPAAIALTSRHAAYRSTKLDVCIANAENLPFPDNHFDMVVSSGVLHHTPNTQQAFHEAFRVTKPNGTGKITLYRKGLLHRKAIFPITKLAMRLTGTHHPGTIEATQKLTVDDFIRCYDGMKNPVGVGKMDHLWAQDLLTCGWQLNNREVHFFPLRFLPFQSWIPDAVHGLLDRIFGTMVYFDTTKP